MGDVSASLPEELPIRPPGNQAGAHATETKVPGESGPSLHSGSLSFLAVRLRRAWGLWAEAGTQ